jgi:hypothetical protein
MKKIGSIMFSTEERDGARRLIAMVMGMPEGKDNGWIARLHGTCPNYGFVREFARHSGKPTGDKPIPVRYVLPGAGIYNYGRIASIDASWTEEKGYFAIDEDGDAIPVTREIAASFFEPATLDDEEPDWDA